MSFWNSPPAPIILPIINVQQAGQGLCWAACVAQVIAFVTGHTPSQHQLCAAAGVRPEQGATIGHIASVVQRLTGARCHNPGRPTPAIYSSLLEQRHPIIVSVSVGEAYIDHAVLLRGMVRDGSTWHAVVNDPNLAPGFALFTPFDRLTATWHESLAVVPGSQRGRHV